MPIAIETGRSLLVEALRAAGQPVIAMNPVIVANYRKRQSPAKLKSDRGDAALLANIVRVNGTHHHPLPHNTDTDTDTAITELSRTQLQAHHTRQVHYNRLHSVLRDVHPAACHAWQHLPGNLLRPEARAVLALAPTPSTAARLPRRVLRDALVSAGRTRLVDAHVDRLFTLFREPVLRHRPAVEPVWEARVRMCLADLDHACHTLDDITEHLEAAFLTHPHAPIYTYFPGASILTGARLLGEIGDDPTRFATGHHWAFSSLTRSPGCRAHYDRRRAAGDRNAAALRNLYSRLLKCLHYCLTTNTHYDETRAFPTQSAR